MSTTPTNEYPDSALIHLRVPAAQKALWVRLSRAEGVRLTDWIVGRVEASLTDQGGAWKPKPEGPHES